MPDHSPIVIGVAGRIGSGKTLVARYLEENCGFQYLRYSLILAEWFNADPGGKTRLQEVGWGVMSGEGQRELNRRLIAKVDPQRDCAVDGLRHPIDYEELRRSFKDRFYLIFVETSAEIRFSRLRPRYESHEAFLAADEHPVEQNIDSLRSDASAIIRGDVSLAAFKAELDLIISGFKGQPAQLDQ